MKKRLALVAFILAMGLAGVTGSANETGETQAAVAVQAAGDEGVEPRIADIIETKYRENNGHLEYRRWNATKGRWVDPYWIRIV